MPTHQVQRDQHRELVPSAHVLCPIPVIEIEVPVLIRSASLWPAAATRSDGRLDPAQVSVVGRCDGFVAYPLDLGDAQVGEGGAGGEQERAGDRGGGGGQEGEVQVGDEIPVEEMVSESASSRDDGP